MPIRSGLRPATNTPDTNTPDDLTGDTAESVHGGVVHNDLESPSLVMLVLLSTLGVLLYAWFLLNPRNAGDPLLYFTVVACESFVMFQILLALWTALSAPHNPRTFAYHAARRALFMPTGQDLDDAVFGDGWLDSDDLRDGPGEGARMQLHGRRITVDVFITTYGEPVDVVRRTVEAARDLRGLHRTHILDDGGSAEIRALAQELGARYIARAGNEGAKAGNINHALSVTDGDFFLILDADFVPLPNLLVETLPFFGEDRVAFVQTPQVYGNIRTFISKGAGFMQSVFYSLTQPGKNRFNSAFCVGTNVVFRRSAVEDIGGIAQDSKSEDIWTSLRLHERGWKSVYIPAVLAVGDTPETIEAYTKQQLRWATGAFEILFRNNPLVSRRLTVDQRLQYFGTATFYFNGLVTLVLLLLPSLQIYLGLSPVSPNVPPAEWALYYSGFYLMQVVMAAYTMGRFRWQVLLLSTVSFAIYTRACADALRGKDTAWHVTGRAGRANSPFNYTVPQVLMFVFLLGTSVVGLLATEGAGHLSVAVAWNLVNTFALGLFLGIAAKEAVLIRRGSRQAAQTPAPAPSRQAPGPRPAGVRAAWKGAR